MAAEITWAVLLGVALAILAGGAADLCLWWMGEPTISQYLRDHPRLFTVPALLMLVFLALLAVHLFACPWGD